MPFGKIEKFIVGIHRSEHLQRSIVIRRSAIDDIEIEEEDHDEKLDMFFLKIMRMASLSNLSIAKKIAEKIKYSNYSGYRSKTRFNNLIYEP